MSLSIIIVIGLAAGLHAALYGTYKDSPHESFLLRRFVRELVFATGIAAVLATIDITGRESPFIVYLSVFALARIVTEFWKLFLRVEPQDGFRIPTQIHWIRSVVHNSIIRLPDEKAFPGWIFETLPTANYQTCHCTDCCPNDH